jgi:hypothetical protein
MAESKSRAATGGVGGLWFLGFIGALVYYIHYHSGEPPPVTRTPTLRRATVPERSPHAPTTPAGVPAAGGRARP